MKFSKNRTVNWKQKCGEIIKFLDGQTKLFVKGDVNSHSVDLAAIKLIYTQAEQRKCSFFFSALPF